ncbi:MAG TPA: hypothetical protein VHY84_14125 [Bryobacteraceae bacterium]|nr:hypothetical protein [Bryobacteraceae bacterium]
MADNSRNLEARFTDLVARVFEQMEFDVQREYRDQGIRFDLLATRGIERLPIEIKLFRTAEIGADIFSDLLGHMGNVIAEGVGAK